MEENKVITFLKTKKKVLITLAIIFIAWILGQLTVPALLKAIFL